MIYTYKVSVIVRTFNRAQLLNSALASLDKQVYNNFEVIIIDDGSSDSTKEVVDAFRDKLSGRIKYIYQDRIGRSAALNTGLKEVKGEFIAFLDDDDWWDPYFLQHMHSMITSESADLVLCGAHYVVDRRFIKKPAPCLSERNILGKMIMDNLIHPASLLVRKDTLLREGFFDESLSSTMDWDMWLRILLKTRKVKVVDRYLSFIRVHGRNVSIDKAKMATNQLKVFKKLRNFNDRLSSEEQEILERSTARRKIFLGVSLIENGDKANGRESIVSGLSKASLGRKIYGFFILSLSALLNGEQISRLLYFINRLTGRYKIRPYFYA